MKLNARVVRMLRTLALSSLCALTAGSAYADQVRTNWVERWITNAIEITVPANRFVSEYHTNVVLRTRTNVVNFYSTNTVTQQVTNRVWIDSIRTNFVLAYQTNYKTLHVTNWTTVVVLKTNWVQQTVTNVAQVDLAKNESSETPTARTEPAQRTAASGKTDALLVDASRGTKSAPANQADVRLKARWANREGSEVQVQQWRVQSQEGSILCFGQDSEFRRNLPYGSYKVELKARFEPNTPVVTVRGVLSVSAREVRLDQNSLARR